MRVLGMTKKIVIRADDVGYTPVNNMGAFEAFDKGIATAADVMLDTPGSIDALERLRDYPWISVGWHTHFWGSPVLGAEKVPSLVDAERGHFRKDLLSAEDFEEAELIAEMHAQIELCIGVLGKAPDTSEILIRGAQPTKFAKAKMKTCDEYGIIYDFASRVRWNGAGFDFGPVGQRWKDRKIFWMEPGPAYAELRSDSIAEIGKYDPVKYYTEDRGKTALLPSDAITGQAWHPGYVDYYMCREGDHGPNARKFLECRPLDVHALCSEELKRWVKENRVELMNFRDAMYGTREYQNHLRNIGSELCVL